MKFLFALVTQCWHKSFWVFDTERYWKAYNGGFFFACFLRNAEACILKILSSSNRGGGVAPDCMDFALKVFFPWLPAPFCFRSLRTELRELIYWLLWTTTTTTRPAEGSQAEEGGGVFWDVHLFNSGLYSMWWSFYNQLRLLIFPSLSDYFPPQINQNLSERKIKTRPYWIWSGFVLYSMHGY